MKSTIKSAFAILAVALMIMAAVVPMVGVFSQEDSSAATTGTLVDEEYNDTIADPIQISGKIYKADGTTAIENAKVIVKWDGKSLSGLTTAAGVYTVTTDVKITDVITKVEVSVDTTSEYVDGTTKNPALGMAFPTVTLDNVNKTHNAAGGNAVDIISGTALVKGQIQTKEGTNISLAGVTISGAEGTVVTKAYSAAPAVTAGSFEFYGKVGTAYTITASAIDTTFAYYGAGTEATSYTVTTANDQNIVLKAKDNILTITTLSVPVITSITKLAPSEGKKDTITALGTPVIGKDVAGYKAYAKITFNTATSAAATDFEQTKFVLDYFTSVARSAINTTGVATEVVETLYKVVPKDLSIAAAALTGETLASVVYYGNVYMDAGNATKVIPSAVNLNGTYTDTTAIPKTTAAKIVDGTFYVGNVVAYNADGTAKTIYDAGAKILPTFAGYTFTETAAAADMKFVAQNAFLFTGTVSALPTGVTKATISVTATNYVAVKLTVTPGAEADRTYSFYVPQNTSVTVKAPTDAYNPSQYVNDNSIDALTKTITIPEFVYDATTENATYTGIITLNGEPISLAAANNYIAISVDGGKLFTTAIPVVFDEYNVYEFTVPKVIPESDIFVKIAQAYEESAVAGVSGYAFPYEYMEPAVTDHGYYYSFYSITNAVVEEIEVKEAKIKATIKDAADLVIPGQEVDFYMVNSGATSFATATVKIELGSAITDLDGVASIKAGKTVAAGGYKIVAIPDDESIYGEYTFTWAQEEFAPAYADKDVVANEVTTYGYVTMKDTKAIVDDPEVSYVAYNLAGVKIIGEAVVLNDVYFIITPAGYSVDVYVDGLKFGDNYYVTAAAVVGGQFDLVNAVVALPVIIPVITYDIITVGEYAGLINVSAIEAAEGDVITVSAPSSYVEANDETTYTDAYVKYTFVAWYVNGKEISKDCNTSFVMTDSDAAVSCDYAVEYVKTSDVNDVETPAAPENGVDTNVLIIGICAVVIALIAVVYAVIKRN